MKFKGTLASFILTIPLLLHYLGFDGPAMFLALIAEFPLAIPLERMFAGIFGRGNYAIVAATEFISLLAFFIIALWSFYRIARNRIKKGQKINFGRHLVFLIASFFVIHPLFFTAWAFLNAQHAGDGQFIFGVFTTYPTVQFVFYF